jgi:urease accessory protein
MASAMLTSAAGGVLQGDVLETHVTVGDGAWLHLGTQSATRFYRMPEGRARLSTTLTVGAGAWLELVPDPWIPYAGAIVDAHTRCEVNPSGVLVLAEVIGGGRVARGERLAYERIETVVDVAVGGVDRARDTLTLIPGGPAGGSLVGRLGPFAAVGSLLVVATGVRGGALAAAADAMLVADAWHGAGDLPGGAGAWLRVLAADGSTAARVVHAAWTSVRQALGAPLPPADRRA